MRRRVPPEHEYDEHGQCKWCEHKDQSKASFAAPSGSPVPPVMSDEEFDDLVERTNQACIAKHGKTLCQLLEEGEAESAQENIRI